MPVIPNRFSVSPVPATMAPIAMSNVAGTRLWSCPLNRLAIAPGSDTTKFTVIATGAITG